MTEQPFKIPYYAALLRLLYDRPASEEASEPLGRLVLDDFWKAFREFMEKHAWREMRLCVGSLQYFRDQTRAYVSTGPFLCPLDCRTSDLSEVDV